ncbi:hypothetical protein DXG01_014106 [Tephrocybe rancida]|nr:hypothetical protein DXG01_014106 [Tephrocybe rancida]
MASLLEISRSSIKAPPYILSKRFNSPFYVKLAAGDTTSVTIAFSNTEILRLIFRYCSTHSLVAFSHTERVAQHSVRIYFRLLIADLLNPFLTKPVWRAWFFGFVTHTNAAICGSFASALINPLLDIKSSDVSTNLVVLVPRTSGWKWAGLLKKVGYSGGFLIDVSLGGEFGGVSHSSRVFRNSSGYTITITESHTPSILPMLLSTPVTSHMNFVTAVGIYCLYPVLAAVCLSLSRSRHITGSDFVPCAVQDRIKSLAYTYHSSTEEWGVACGTACPAIWRRMSRLEGVGCFRWGGVFPSEQAALDDEVVDGHRLKWRLGLECRNVHCPNGRYIQEERAIDIDAASSETEDTDSD